MSMAIVVVNHNTREHLAACLASVMPERPDQVIVVDNASTDGSPESVRRAYPEVEVIEAGNGGFGAGANIGISHARHPYVLLLNSDTRLRPGALDALTRYLDERPDVGLAGPQLLNPDGSLQPSVYPNPGPLADLIRWTSVARIASAIPKLRARYLVDNPHSSQIDVGWLAGAALAIRKAAFDEIGGFDASFFMYSEEVDLAYRMQKAGWRVRFAPVAEVSHVGGASTAAYRAEMMTRLYNSMTHFYRKHYGSREQAALRVILSYFMIRNLARDRVRLWLASSEEARRTLADDLVAWRQVLATTWES
jgi:hypothetical protein